MQIAPEFERQIDEVITHYPVSKRSASLPLLHLFQEQFGFISDEAVTWIAAKLELQPINVLELVTFYPMFRREPAGTTHLRVCRTLSCAMAGSYQLRDELAQAAGIDLKKWQMKFEGKAHGDSEHSHEIGGHGVHNAGHGNPVAVSADGRIRSNSWNASRAAGARRSRWSRTNFTSGSRRKRSRDILNDKPSDATVKRVHAPHPKERRIVFENIDREGWANDIETYLHLRRLRGSEEGAEDAAAGNRGRGEEVAACAGAAARVSVRSEMGLHRARRERKPIYLICNADESEPGTFKDRQIIHKDPHQLIEGMIISCFAIDVQLAYIYIRGELPEGAKILKRRSTKRGRRIFSARTFSAAASIWRSTCIAARALTFAARKPA